MKLLTKDDLNEDQKNALEFIYQFLEGPNRQMVLTGPAGTGKTSLINVLLDQLDEDPEYKVVCTAPTNQAVNVIAENTGRPFGKTIFAILGLTVNEIDDHTVELTQVTVSKLKSYDLVIIDEASMVSRELVRHIQSELSTSSSPKIIYVGDRCQLPPVEDAENGLTESVVFQSPLIVSLSKVMRTAEENPILGAVTAMRQDMLSPVDLFKHESKVTDDGIGMWFETDPEKFKADMVAKFTSQEYANDTNHALVVAYTNKEVDEYNAMIRAAIYPNVTDSFVGGEEIRVNSPYIVNENSSKMWKPKRGSGKQEAARSIIYSTGERLMINNCISSNDPVYNIPCYCADVFNYLAPKSMQVMRRVYIVDPKYMHEYYKKREELADEAKAKLRATGYNGTAMYTRKEAWKDYHAFKAYYLVAGYTYALTVHKAQGTTVQNVFVLENNINICHDAELRNKLKYTAFTRAAKELHVLY